MLSQPLTYTLWHAEKLPNHVIAHHLAVRLNRARDVPVGPNRLSLNGRVGGVVPRASEE